MREGHTPVGKNDRSGAKYLLKSVVGWAAPPSTNPNRCVMLRSLSRSAKYPNSTLQKIRMFNVDYVLSVFFSFMFADLNWLLAVSGIICFVVS